MNRIWNVIIFIGSLLALIISVKLFWNMGIFVDEFNTSPDVVCGGNFWSYMDWLRLFVLAIITIVSGINLFKNSKDR
ncbi:MAG: hypothetical protein J6K48_02135 [Lachnospiraceae bacterium]|nr:hypothetical protein [Lachnospiraceae bacterium]